MPSVALTISII